MGAGFEKSFDVEGVGRVRECGNPEAHTVVLLHGFMQSGNSWRKVAPLLKHHHVVAPDLLGHGETALRATEDLSLDAYVEQVNSLVDWVLARDAAYDDPAGNELAIERSAAIEHPTIERPTIAHPTGSRPTSNGTVSLVGYSMGGRIAALYALRYPEKVSALVLESAGLGPQNEEERAARSKKTRAMVAQLDQSVKSDPASPLAAFLDWWEALPLFASQAELSEQLRAGVRAERLANDPAALRRNLEEAGQHCMIDVRPGLANLNKPILYLVGERDVAYTEIARSLMRAWAEDHTDSALFERGFVQVSVIPQVGHNTHLEAPEEYALLVDMFLSRSS